MTTPIWRAVMRHVTTHGGPPIASATLGAPGGWAAAEVRAFERSEQARCLAIAIGNAERYRMPPDGETRPYGPGVIVESFDVNIVEALAGTTAQSLWLEYDRGAVLVMRPFEEEGHRRIIVLRFTQDGSGRFGMVPIGLSITPGQRDASYSRVVEDIPYDDHDQTKAQGNLTLMAIWAWLMSAPRPEVRVVTAPASSLSEVTARKIARRVGIPDLSPSRVIVADLRSWRSTAPTDGPTKTHASPTGHSRRGHPRVLARGTDRERVVWVRPHAVRGGATGPTENIIRIRHDRPVVLH